MANHVAFHKIFLFLSLTLVSFECAAEKKDFEDQRILIDTLLKEGEELLRDSQKARTRGLLNFVMTPEERNKLINAGISKLEKAAELGSDEAMLRLGELFDDGYKDLGIDEYGRLKKANIILPSDKKAALMWYQRAAQLENKDAFVKLGHKYKSAKYDFYTGRQLSCMQRIEYLNQALIYLNKADYEIDSSNVYYELSGLYLGGEEGCAKSIEKGKEYLKKATQHNKEALKKLGDIYYKSKEYSLSLDAYEQFLNYATHKSSYTDLNEILAVLFKLGYMYENGLGKSKDVAKAMLYYTKAANNGLLEAQHNLEILRKKHGSFTPS